MSWADDIRCLYCDGKLPLYRKLTNGQFCSTPHRKAYWQEQERLAVERLHQTHSSLRAYRPNGPVEAILGPEEPLPEEIPGFESGLVVEPPVTSLALVVASTHDAPVTAADRPTWLAQVNGGEVPLGSFMRNPALPRPHWLADHLAGAEPEPFVRQNALRRPVNFYQAEDGGFGLAGSVEFSSVECLPEQAQMPLIAQETAPEQVANQPVMGLYVLGLAIDSPQADAGPSQQALENQPPAGDALLALPVPAVWDYAFERRALPIATGAVAQPAIECLQVSATAASSGLPLAGLQSVPMGLRALAPNISTDGLRSLDLRTEVEHPTLVLGTAPLRPGLRLAAGRRYAVETKESAAPVISAPELAVLAPNISLPERKARVLRAAIHQTAGNQTAIRPATVSPASLRQALSQRAVPQKAAPTQPALPADYEPKSPGLLPLACAAQPKAAVDIRPAPEALTIPQPLQSEPMRPTSKLEPIDGTSPMGTAGDFLITPPPYAKPDPAAEAKRVHVWTHGIDFWKRAPRDLKTLVFAIPLLLALALHPSLPKVRVAAPAGIQKNFEQSLNTQWMSVRQTVVDRAAVALDEDFRSGLDEWVSRGDATTDWSFDPTGFVKPGPLAMYRPSIGLTDYQVQFLGLIDRKALSWVVRAADFENFYVVKLVVLKAGPLPTIGVTRYAVVNGKADTRVDTSVLIDARTDMLYRIRMDVHGSDFALLIQGQMVDSWTEPRLRHGGVGFFSARGEESRLRWVQVTHQYDMLGRLCAYLAPYNIPSTSGSMEQ